MSTQESSQPSVDDKFTFLQKLTSGRKHHGNKSFYQHLFNVYAYLKSQAAPEEVCDAGLFHAIYGTEFYQFESAAITRDVVRGYIGEYAEELVYIFCGLRTGRFRSIVNNTPAWSLRQHLDLCWMEYANLWDHREFKDVSTRLDTLSQTIQRIEGIAEEQTDLLPPPYPPRLLSLDQVAFLSRHGWLSLDLSATDHLACQNVLAEAESFFAQEADAKQKEYPSLSATDHGFYAVPEEKEYVTFRHRSNPESPFEHCVADAWEKAVRLLHRILCDLAYFHSCDPSMWDPFLEDVASLPQKKDTDTTTFMRVFQYYPGSGVAEQHIDLGLLTLCFGADSGLEVVEHSPDASRWISSPAQQPIILIGRMASMLLRGHIRSGRHRVISNPHGRRSMVLALRPCLRAQIDLGSADGQRQSFSAREYWAKTTGSTWNVNAKKDEREEQRQKSKLARDRYLGESELGT